MSTREKLKQRIFNLARDITPDEIKVFMKHEGFELKSVNGDHFIYKHPKLDNHVNIVMNKNIKLAYIKNVKNAIQILEKVER